MYEEDLTLSQITRLTGMPKTSVYRTLKGIKVTDSAEQKEPSLLFRCELEEPIETFVFNESTDEIW
ncbi:MAG: helix-turn-helix domain-containing protein [Clostridia bacterium]|nr:helix-turn-helix domain-containing protein [Clostridia bacterium]